jgi:predicted Zn-dependent protease
MFEMDRYSEAEHFLDESLAANPDNPLAYDALGDLYFRQQQYAEAIASYRMAVVQQEDLANAHLGLGQSLEAVGHLTEAEDALQKALYHDPHNPMVLYRLGQVHVLLKNTARAQAYYEMAMENAAGNIELQNSIRGALNSLSESGEE